MRITFLYASAALSTSAKNNMKYIKIPKLRQKTKTAILRPLVGITNHTILHRAGLLRRLSFLIYNRTIECMDAGEILTSVYPTTCIIYRILSYIVPKEGACLHKKKQEI